MINKIGENRVVGQTKDVGFQIGARKTFDISPQQAWDVITSDAGIELWLGEAPSFELTEGVTYQTDNGTKGEVRVVKPGSHIRMTWQPSEWDTPSLIQVRVFPSGTKTTIGFHQEHLAGPKEREAMRQRWQKVLQDLPTLFDQLEDNYERQNKNADDAERRI